MAERKTVMDIVNLEARGSIPRRERKLFFFVSFTFLFLALRLLFWL